LGRSSVLVADIDLISIFGSDSADDPRTNFVGVVGGDDSCDFLAFSDSSKRIFQDDTTLGSVPPEAD